MPDSKLIRSILCSLALLPVTSFSQKLFEPKTTFNVELTLPNATANKPFNTIMQGLGSGAIFGQYSFPFHLHVGGGVKYSIFTINQFRVSEPVTGSLQSGSGFLKIGYDKFHSERFATDFDVKVGYSEHMIFSTLNKANGINPLRFNSAMVEGTIGLILTADERNAYRLVLGYGVQGFGFKPPMIGLSSNEGYPVDNLNTVSQYLIVGFGYTLYFNGKKSD